jgi:tetratricopeptide (TPR) repeat protein
MGYGGGSAHLRCSLPTARSPRFWLAGAAVCWLSGVAWAQPPLFAPAVLPLMPPSAATEASGSDIASLEDPPGLESTSDRGQAALSVFDGPHTEAMELVAREADAHTRRGFELAGRRAYYSAREEFILALRALSQALDVQRNVSAHSNALAAGMRALDEANDFVPRGAGFEANLNVAMIITAHETPVYRYEPVDGVTALVARQRYYTYAREQLGVSAGREFAGSMALHGLGKLYAAMATEQGERKGRLEAEAMVFYQAALLIAPQNHMASNDLGTLMAAKGSWVEARNHFSQSLAAMKTPVAWSNLAKAHQHLGEKELAAKAEREAQLALKAVEPKAAPVGKTTAVKVEWVAPDGMTAAASEQFLNNNQKTSESLEAKPRQAAAKPSADALPQGTQSWWPWKRSTPTK